MKIVRFLAKIFAISVMSVTIIIAGICLYMRFYGNAIVEKSLSGTFGSKVKFEGVALNLDKSSLDFRGFSILSEVDFNQTVFNAERVVLLLNKERFDAEKKIVLDELYIKKGVLNIVRQKDGRFNLAYPVPPKAEEAGPVAYAAEMEGSVLYNLASKLRKVTIEDSNINFTDHFIPVSGKTFFIYFDRFNLNFTSGQKPVSPSGHIPIKFTLSLRIPRCRYGDGSASLNADMAAYPDRVDAEAALETRYIDLMLFLPYFAKYTPFSFNDGLFSSATSFRMHNSAVDSLTTITFHKLSLLINPGMENAQFLSTSVNSLAKYLTSSSGEILFDFVVQGPANHPGIGLGPKVKFAIGMVIIEEVGKMMQQIQAAQTR